MGLIATMMANVWVRRAGIVLAVLGLLYAAKIHYIDVGKTQGKTEAAQDAKDQTAAEVAKARTDFLGQLDAQNKLIASYANQLSVATQQTAQAMQLAAQISKDRTAAAGKVGALPDSEVHGFVISTLNLRKPGDVAACYTPTEEREIALRVVDDPKCKQQIDQDKAATDSGAKQLAAAVGQRNAMVTNYNNLVQYTSALAKAYTEIYNDFPRKRNWLLTVATLGVKGKPKKLSYPDPKSLQLPAAQ